MDVRSRYEGEIKEDGWEGMIAEIDRLVLDS